MLQLFIYINMHNASNSDFGHRQRAAKDNGVQSDFRGVGLHHCCSARTIARIAGCGELASARYEGLSVEQADHFVEVCQGLRARSETKLSGISGLA